MQSAANRILGERTPGRRAPLTRAEVAAAAANVLVRRVPEGAVLHVPGVRNLKRTVFTARLLLAPGEEVLFEVSLP